MRNFHKWRPGRKQFRRPADKQEAKSKGWTPQGEYYDRLTTNFGQAGDCIGCAQCERVCPQHLHITEHLKTVAKHFLSSNLQLLNLKQYL